MSQDAEKIKMLIAFKQNIQKRIEKLQSELNDLHVILETIDLILLEKGFKRAEIPKTPNQRTILTKVTEKRSSTSAPLEQQVVPLKADNDDLLANMFVSEDSLQVLFAEDKEFDFNTPPFQQFLVERVFNKMHEKDNKLASTGQIPPGKIFSYNIVQDGPKLREIRIKNINKERVKELKSSIRWTLAKMYEKQVK